MPDQRPSPPAIRLSPAALLALLLFGALALFCHAYLRIRLQNAGISPEHAYNLSYLVVPPIALAPVPVILRGQTETFKKLFDPRRLDLRLVLGAAQRTESADLYGLIQQPEEILPCARH
mgnify:CR=1 FL=1